MISTIPDHCETHTVSRTVVYCMPAAGNRIGLQKLSRTQNILYLKIGLLTLAMAKEPIRRIRDKFGFKSKAAI